MGLRYGVVEWIHEDTTHTSYEVGPSARSPTRHYYRHCSNTGGDNKQHNPNDLTYVVGWKTWGRIYPRSWVHKRGTGCVISELDRRSKAASRRWREPLGTMHMFCFVEPGVEFVSGRSASWEVSATRKPTE